MCNTTVKIICDSARKCAGLPRENGVLLILLRLLYLGTSALVSLLLANLDLPLFLQKYANEGVLEQKTEIIACLTRFLPLFTQMVAKNFFRDEKIKAPGKF